MHAVLGGELRHWVGEVRKDLREKAERMRGSEVSTKEISSPSCLHLGNAERVGPEK